MGEGGTHDTKKNSATLGVNAWLLLPVQLDEGGTHDTKQCLIGS